MSMKWIKVTPDSLPPVGEDVLICVRFPGFKEYEWEVSELSNRKSKRAYIEPNSGRAWNLGSAINYVISHFARISLPKDD